VDYVSYPCNSGFQLDRIADLRADLEVFPGQTYRGASGGLEDKFAAPPLRLTHYNQLII
jgi:hypothetical protein